MNRVISTPNAPKAIGTYSQAILANGVLYLSGQIGVDPITMELRSESFLTEAHQVFQNLKAVLEAAGGSLGHLVKMTVYLTDLNNFSALNEVMSHYMKAPYPARATVQVSALPKSAAIEIEGIAVL